jgi:hypothetical protein
VLVPEFLLNPVKVFASPFSAAQIDESSQAQVSSLFFFLCLKWSLQILDKSRSPIDYLTATFIFSSTPNDEYLIFFWYI